MDCTRDVIPSPVASGQVLLRAAHGAQGQTTRAFVFNGDVASLQQALCDGQLRQADIEFAWTGDTDDRVDLSRFQGLTLYVATMRDDLSVVNDGAFAINADSSTVEVSLD